MPKRKGNFNAWRLEKLADPINAANYLNAALEEAPEIFLDVVKDVIQATSVSKVAKKARVTRESIYRSFSATGNPTLETLVSVLHALNLKISKVVPLCGFSESSSSPGSAGKAHKPRTRHGRRGLRDHRQLSLAFESAWLAPASPNVSKIEGLGTTIATSRASDTIRTPQRVVVQQEAPPWLLNQGRATSHTYAYAQ